MKAETPPGEVYKPPTPTGELLKKGEGVRFHGIDWGCFHSDQATGFIRLKVLEYSELDLTKYIKKGKEVTIDNLKYNCIYDDPRTGVAHLKIRKPKGEN